MTAYLCKWPNGDMSFVTGRNRLEIDRVLDEVGNVDAAKLIRLGHAAAIHFRLNVDASHGSDYLTLEHFDERSTDDIATKVYPALTDAVDKMFDDKGEYHHNDALYKTALEAETTRVGRSRSSDPGVADVQDITDMPKSVLEHLRQHVKRS